MKKLFLLTFVALLSLVMSVALVGAQDEAAYEADTSGVMVQVVTSGSFVEADGTMTLMVEGMPGYASMFINTPNVLLNNYNLVELSDDWTFANSLEDMDALTATAYLQLEDYIVTLNLTDASYDLDTEMLSYTVEVVSVRDLVNADSKDEPAAPVSFDAGSLYISLDADFLNGLSAGQAARLSDLRPVTDNNPCPCGP